MNEMRLVKALGAIILLAGCSPKTSVRMVDDPSGTAIEYGKPRSTVYTAELDAARDDARVTIYQVSRCDVIPVTVMQRYEERLHGDEVVQRNPITKKQVAGKPQGETACNQSYARNLEVMLSAGSSRFSMGKTDARGQVTGNLSKIFQVAGYGDLPAEVKVLVRPAQAQPTVEVGTLTMAELKKHEERVKQLIGELEQILAKGTSGQTPADITRSYELYSELQDIAGYDPRVEGISARFWELYTGRKQEAMIGRTGMLLEELGKAQETLKVMGDAAIPLYVQAAVSAGVLDQRALEWSSLRLIRAIKGTPTICTGGFAWSGIGSYGWPPDARLAGHYAHYAYGDEVPGMVGSACRY
ncbi:MAG TPA: hypothetical protein VLC09_16185 [Polyangiaceae bacterium]|nr:hypothetical protein [Polyangiaceae bacterium]